MTKETFNEIKALGSCDCFENVAISFKRLSEEEGDGRFKTCFDFLKHPFFKNLSTEAKQEIYEILLLSLTRKRNPLNNALPKEVVELLKLRFES